jgi:hypothetical protein
LSANFSEKSSSSSEASVSPLTSSLTLINEKAGVSSSLDSEKLIQMRAVDLMEKSK